MENYIKAENEEEFKPEVPIEGTKEGVLVMHVKAGSKIKNLMQFAEKRFSSDSTGQIVWEGSGDAVSKTITCAEIMKKKSSYPLHQITRLASTRIVETWKPRLDGLDDIRVNRQLPLVKILLSKDPLDADANGYQAPEDAHGLFDRGQGANRSKKNNKPRQQQQERQQQQRRRSRPSTAAAIDEKDETLLADTIRNEGAKKQNKQARKKKRAEKQEDAKKQAANADPSSKTESQIAAKTGDEAASLKVEVKTEAPRFENESERTKSETKTDLLNSASAVDARNDSKSEAMDVGD